MSLIVKGSESWLCAPRLGNPRLFVYLHHKPELGYLVHNTNDDNTSHVSYLICPLQYVGPYSR